MILVVLNQAEISLKLVIVRWDVIELFLLDISEIFTDYLIRVVVEIPINK